MNKKIKKILILIFLLFITVLIFWVKLWYYWNTNPEPLCNRAGGFWGPVGCENLCDKTQADYDCERQNGHMDCTCGRFENKCWDGKKCVARVNK